MSKVTAQQLQALLTQHACPTPLHVLRMRFLGAIASPQLDASPTRVLEQAWGGSLPEFTSQDDAEEMNQAFVEGLWNQLSQHRNASFPFRLQRSEVKPTRYEVLPVIERFSQELGGFVDGLLGGQEEIHLPEKAHKPFKLLSEMHSLFAASVPLLADESAQPTDQELKDYLLNIQGIMSGADDAINLIIQSCNRARAHRLKHPGHTAFTTRRLATAVEESSPDSDRKWAEEEQGQNAIIYSPLNQTLTRNGVTVEVQIYKSPFDDWKLKLVDDAGNSFVWTNSFTTDQAAFDEAAWALEEEPLEFIASPAGASVN